MCFERRRLWSAVGGAAALVAWGFAWAEPAEARSAIEVQAVRIGPGKTKTRLVLDLSAGVNFTTFTLGDPYRVVIDLPAVEWKIDPLKTPKGGLIQAFRYGHFRDSVSRVVLDVSGPVEIAKSFLLRAAGGRPHRLVVDLRPVGAAVFANRQRVTDAAAPPEPAETVPLPKLRPPRRGKKLIAIDPGHGGVDPGTLGSNGTLEKRVTLRHAAALAGKLRASGRYRVVMTRSRDVFVPLRKRVTIARRAAADLFISLHADANPDRRVRGASVYTLSERASDREAAALAAKENKADMIAGVNLTKQPSEVANILIDLAQRETMNGSAAFARVLTSELGKVQMLLRNTHRFAGFAVLKAPDIPSVLVELGHLSNPAEERSLRGSKARHRVADAIIRAIDAYFAREQAFKR